MGNKIIAGNNLIADFMELDYQDYNIDWRVLMPVVEKIKKFYDDESDNYPLEFWEEDVTVIDLKITESIDVVWSYSIKFITWYNSQPKIKQ